MTAWEAEMSLQNGVEVGVEILLTVFRNGVGLKIPALLTSTSTPPKRSMSTSFLATSALPIQPATTATRSPGRIELGSSLGEHLLALPLSTTYAP